MIDLKSILVLSAISSACLGCGGNEPIGTLQSSGSTQVPSLSLPFLAGDASTTTPFGQVTGGVTNSGFTFHGSGVTAVQVLAPADGVVVNIDNTVDAGVVAVTIRHSARLSTRFRFLSGAFVQQGNFVSKGSSIGNGGNQINTVFPGQTSANAITLMEVYAEGGLVCPLSYFDTTSLQSTVLSTGEFGGFSPCQ